MQTAVVTRVPVAARNTFDAVALFADQRGLSHIKTGSQSACYQDSPGTILGTMIRIREAAVAGSFYPADSGELHSMVHRMLDAAAPDAGPAPKALIVPHAGLVYSGSVAGRTR